MLGVGFKQTDTATPSLLRPLKEYIQREYAVLGSDTALAKPSGLSRQHEEALEAFFQLRNDVSLVRTPSSISKHVLLRYYAQLESFGTRFPCSDPTTLTTTGRGSLQLQFTWNDSFCPRKKITQSGIKFEQSAIMFNFGALESQLGVQTDRSTPDGLKAACKHFMAAAGAFTKVKDELVDKCLGSRTPDMSPEGLGMLIQLMLAQAQACFYEKAIKDQMKDAIKAKLVHQALDFYASALDYCNSSALNTTIDRSWGHHILFQVHCMKAATQYWQSKAAKEIAINKGSGYGEEIARLIASDAECQEAIKCATQNKLPVSLINSIKQLQRVVLENLETAKKENASIYLENIPRFSDLPPIGKASMVKPLLLTQEEIDQELGGVDLFEKFVPNSILTRASTTKEEVIQFVRQINDRVQEENEFCKQKLHALGLPASIEAFESGEGIPSTIWSRIDAIQRQNSPSSNNFFTNISTNLRVNKTSSQEAERKLEQIEKSLSKEETQDNICRQNYGSTKWSRPLSATLNQSFHNDVDRYFRLLHEARNADKQVEQKLHENHEQLLLLCKSKSELDAEIPSRKQEQQQDIDVSLLSMLLVRLSELMKNKEQVVKDLVLSQEKFNVIPTIFSVRATKEEEMESVLASEKHLFQDPFMTKISQFTKEQQQILEEIEVENGTFERQRSQDTIVIQRERFIQRLSDAIAIYEQLVSNAEEGKKFYIDLNSKIEQLFQTVQDHCTAREIERKELELNFSHDDVVQRQLTQDAELAQRMASAVHVHSQTTNTIKNSTTPPLSEQVNYSNSYAPTTSQTISTPPSYDYVQSDSSSLPSGSSSPSQTTHPYYAYQQQGRNTYNPSLPGAPTAPSGGPSYGSMYATQYPNNSPYGGGYYQNHQQPEQYSTPYPPQQQPPAYNAPQNGYPSPYHAYPGNNGNYGSNFPRSPPGSSV
jgi:programmed cell death 6-interacting protein